MKKKVIDQKEETIKIKHIISKIATCCHLCANLGKTLDFLLIFHQTFVQFFQRSEHYRCIIDWCILIPCSNVSRNVGSSGSKFRQILFLIGELFSGNLLVFGFVSISGHFDLLPSESFVWVEIYILRGVECKSVLFFTVVY